MRWFAGNGKTSISPDIMADPTLLALLLIAVANG
jgi:hypothetical protein